MSIEIKSFYHDDTGTWSYVLLDPDQNLATIIDPVMDFDLSSGKVSYQSANQLIDYIKQNSLTLQWILETHAHADHISAAQHIKQHLGGQIVIGEGIKEVQTHFSDFFNIDMPIDGSQFDRLMAKGEKLPFGSYEFTAYPTPGHTNDSMSYEIDGNLFIGDTFFHPDTGTARCDFPGGDAEKLFDSLQLLLSFPEDYKLWLCHDYPDGREPETGISVSDMKHNVHLQQSNNDKSEFVTIRTKRDSTLDVPRLIYPSVQLNIRAAELPQNESNGRKYLKMPLFVQKENN